MHIEESQKKAKRLLKKLQQRGEVEFRVTDAAQDIHDWVSDFVDLETSGWKGREGTAIASRPDTLGFFIEMVNRFAESGGIRIGRLTVDSAPIAMLTDICSGGHVCGYKTTYDERYAEYSPGFLLEMQNVRWLHELGSEICDSCTDPNNSLINGLYSSRLPFQSIALSLDSGMNRWVNTILPMIQSTAKFAKAVKRTRR